MKTVFTKRIPARGVGPFLTTAALIVSPYVILVLVLTAPGGALLPPLLAMLSIHLLAPAPSRVSLQPGRSLCRWLKDNMDGWEEGTDWGLIWRLFHVPAALLAVWVLVLSSGSEPGRNMQVLCRALGMTLLSMGVLGMILRSAFVSARVARAIWGIPVSGRRPAPTPSR